MSKKIIRKRWIRIFGAYSFDETVELAKKMDIEVITAFKPSICVDIHFKGKGIKENFESFEMDLIEKGHEVFNRCPKTGFQFE
ncbi:MAG: hypothetical protein RRZ64_00275 [Rikenellaceae bacterium]